MNTHEDLREDLTLYALGATTPPDAARVEQHLAECVSCRRELLALREDMGLLALSATGSAPPRRARERLLAQLEAKPSRTHSAPGRGWLWLPWFTTVACALFAALGFFANLKLKADLAAVRSYAASQTAQLAQTRDTLDLLHSPDTVHVSLSSGGAQAKPQGRTIYSPRHGRLLFMASNLAPLPPGKAYELWLVPMTGSPMPAGMFRPDLRGNVSMMDHTMPAGIQAKGFAVTMEDETGARTPTMPLIIVGSTGA